MRCTVRFCALISSLVSFVSVAAEGAQPDVEALVRGNSAFAFALYHELSETEGNAFFSPYSISTALAMTYAGARGKTEKEMAAALRFTLSQTDLHPAFGKVESQLRLVQREHSIRLNIANSLWPQKEVPLLADYVSLISTHYGVRIKALDYMRASEAARRQINAWVEDKTGARIKELIQPGVLGETTRLVLANAIYFKGLWMSPFEKDNTKDAAFNIAAGQTVQTPMMTEKVKCRYASLPACDLLELPYQGKGMAMTVLLPKEVDGIAKLERELTAENVAHWSNELTEQEVLVSLPRFKMTSAFRLEKPLSSLGMADAFHEGKANFAGMDGRADGLYIGAVIHKAFVEVNEEGTEAAAATAVAMLRKSAMPMRTPVFRADHPFVYLIQERSTGSILFMGKLVDPSKAQ